MNALTMKRFFLILMRFISGGIGLFFALATIVYLVEGMITPLIICLLIGLPALAFAFWPRADQNKTNQEAPGNEYSYESELFAAKNFRVVKITYEDQSGNHSTREIEVYRPLNDNYVYGYCRLCKEPRTFLVSGIRQWKVFPDTFTFNPLVEQWFATEGRKLSVERENWNSWVTGQQQRGHSKPYVLKKPIEQEVLLDDEPNEVNQDAWEGGFWETSDPKTLTAHLKFDYKDGNGNLSTRSVRVKEFDNRLHDGIILGHCELRQALRTFRFSRIGNCIDLGSKKPIENLKQHLNDLYEKSPERSTDLLTADYMDVLIVLYYVAKADGQYRKEEKEVIASYVRKLIRDDRITPELIDNALKDVDIPSLPAYKSAVNRILKGGQIDPELLGTCCQKIINTQKTVHPLEKIALDYLDKKRAAFQSTRG